MMEMEISGSYIEDSSVMSPDTSDIADSPISKILPERSRLKYERTYQQFKEWCLLKNFKMMTENVILTYFEDKASVMKPSSLWAIYSMLKTTLRINDNVDVRRFKRLTMFLRKKSRGYHAEKSKILTTEQIKQFIYEADDYKYLLMKVVLIMAISGRCGRYQLVKITIDDIDDRGSVIVVRVPDPKSEYQFRTFPIINLYYIELYRKYAALRPELASDRRFFFQYLNGRCCNQVVGINKIGSIPSLIARYLKLPNPKAYTAHCFRKRPAISSTSETTKQSDNIIETAIKREKSITPPPVSAEQYAETSTMTEKSADDKIEISNKILEFEISDSNVQVTQRELPSTSKTGDSLPDPLRAMLASSGINIGTCNNCTIHFNFVKK